MKWLGAVPLMIRRSMRQHALSSCITIISVALAVGLLLTVVAIEKQSRNAFAAADGGFDAIVGPKGSKLQLILNSLYHIETSAGNVPYSVYTDLKSDGRVKTAIPIAVGDNYKNFRIVGTLAELFTDHQWTEGQSYEFAAGEVFQKNRREAVIGSYVARKTGLGVGSHMHSQHGLSHDESGHHHDDEFIVVGVLETTNTPTDRAIFIPLEGYYRMEGHALMGTGTPYIPRPGVKIPDEHKQVSAVLVKFIRPIIGQQMSSEINKGGGDGQVMMAWPIGTTVADLFNKIGWISRVLELVGYLVAIVAAGSILASIYNTMSERRREFAILRALGGRRRVIFAAIVGESVAITLFGTILGFVLYGLMFSVAAGIIRDETGIVLDVFQRNDRMILIPAAMMVLGAVAGLAPAVKAYMTDVATNLAPST